MPYTEPSSEYEYQVGGSLRVDAPSYVVRKADQQLFEALQRGDFCYVFNARQMGKSSLRVQVMHRLKSEGYACIALDLTRIGSEYLSPHQWYERVVAELWRGANFPGKVDLKHWFQDHPHLSLAQMLDRFMVEILLAHATGKIVIFIDEIDSLLGLDFSVNDFFALIRAYYNQRVDDPIYQRLTFCLLGVATPSDLIRDKTRTPFNIGKAIALDGFQSTEAAPLAKGLVGHVQDLEPAFAEILHWTGGQPFLTQKVCQLVVEAAQTSGQPLATEAIRQVINEQIIQNWESQDEPEHLRTIRDRILRDEKQASQLLGLYQQVLQKSEVIADDSKGQIELRLSGLVVKQGKRLKVRNPIYARVFNDDWVGAQLDQLRPYAAAFNTWLASGGKDDSRLLRGQALEEALQWSVGRHLSSQDSEFLRTSQQLENKETKQANRILTAANRKAKRRLFFSSMLLGVTLLVVGSLSLRASYATLLAKTVVQLEQDSSNALAQFEFDQTKALLTAMRSAYALKPSQCWLGLKMRWRTSKVRLCIIPNFWRKDTTGYLTSRPILTLQTLLDQVRQQDFRIGNGDASVQFTTQGERIIHIDSVGNFYTDNSIRVWDTQGDLLTSFEVPSPDYPYFYTQISPDEQYIAIAEENSGEVKVFDFKGNQLAAVDAHDDRVNIIQFSPDSQRFITGGWDRKAILWDLQGNQLTLLDQAGGILDAQFSSDSRYILILSNRETAQLWDVQGNQLANLSIDSSADASIDTTAVQFSPNNQMIATGDSTGTVQLWNLQGALLKTFKAHASEVEALAFSPDSQQLLTGGDTTARLWDLQGNPLQQFDSSGWVRLVQFSPDGQRIAVGGKMDTIGFDSTHSGGAIYIWDLQGNLLARFWNLPTFSHLQFSPDGQKIAASRNESRLKSDFLIHLPNNINASTAQSSLVRYVHLHPGGQHITTVDEAGVIHLWNRTGQHLTAIRAPLALRERNFYEPSHLFGPVRLSPTGEYLFIAGNHEIQLRDLNGQLLTTFPGSWPDYWYNPISPDGKHVVTLGDIGDEKKVQIWDDQGNLVGKTPGIPEAIRSLDFSPKGDRFLTAGGHGKVRLWNLQGEELASLKAHPSWVSVAYFIDDGGRVIIFTDEPQLWNVDPPQAKSSVAPGIEFNLHSSPGPHHSVFSPKSKQYFWIDWGRFVHSVGYSAAYLWNLDSERSVVLQGRYGWFQGSMERDFNAVQFSWSGDRIATLGQDGYVRVWDDAGNHLAEYEGYKMALSEAGDEIVVVSRENNIPQVKRIDDLEGLLQRGCNWLRPYLALHQSHYADFPQDWVKSCGKSSLSRNLESPSG